MNFGSHGDYEWLVTEHTLGDLLRLCPEIVLGKHIAVTSLDSGPLSLSEQEKAAGWESRKGIAYSPKLTGVENLPHDLFDEWYVFENPKDLGELADPQTNIFERIHTSSARSCIRELRRVCLPPPGNRSFD